MPRYEILTQLVLTAALLQAFQQILAIHILNNWPLHHAGQALENTTTASLSGLAVHIHHWVLRANIIALDPRSLLKTWLLARHVATRLLAVTCEVFNQHLPFELVSCCPWR